MDREQNTGVKNYTRVHGPFWSLVYPTRPVHTAVILDTRIHGYVYQL